jgi:hypothetical protein
MKRVSADGSSCECKCGPCAGLPAGLASSPSNKPHKRIFGVKNESAGVWDCLSYDGALLVDSEAKERKAQQRHREVHAQQILYVTQKEAERQMAGTHSYTHTHTHRHSYAYRCRCAGALRR